MLGSRQITAMQLWKAQAISQNESVTSPAIDLREIINNHKFSLHAIVAGAGNVDMSVLYCSTKDGTYIAESTLIATAQAAGSIFKSFDPVLAPFIKVKVLEKNAGAITSLDLWLNIG